MDGKRPKRDTNSFDDGQPATIEVYSGLYVNENAEIVEGGDDSVFAEKVSGVVGDCGDWAEIQSIYNTK